MSIRINRSNYTLYKKHKKFPNGSVVYQRDFMVTNGSAKNSFETQYGETNFKISRNARPSEQKILDFGEFLMNGDSSAWTLNDVSDIADTTEDKIVLKPNTKDLTDLIYFGSCYETLKNSIKHIIKTFPAELYVTNKNAEEAYNVDLEYVDDSVDVTDFVIISNPFQINVYKNSITLDDNGNDSETGEKANELRYFCESSKKYDIYRVIDGTKEGVVNLDWNVDEIYTNNESGFDGKYFNIKCKENKPIRKITFSNAYTIDGDSTPFIVYQYYINGEYVLLCESKFEGTHISLKDSIIENFFNNLTEIETFLLNQYTIPKYSLSLYKITETEQGLTKTIDNSLHWPIGVGDFNLDITSDAYALYIDSLFTIAEKYDEYYTNNLWKNMVHDSIKNMDLTFTNAETGEDKEDYQIGLSKFEELMYIYGMFFDILKCYIDNIKNVNTITYNGDNNTPDYFLTDVNENCGWDICSTILTLNDGTKTDILYSGNTYQYNLSDANVQFLKNLKINNKSIITRKGTRESLEMILGLFGLTSYDFARNYYNSSPTIFKVPKNDVTVTTLENDVNDNLVNRVFYDKDAQKYYMYTDKQTKKTFSVYETFDELIEEEQLKLYDYKIDEYVCVAKPREYGDNEIETYNSYKNNFYTYDDELQGLPLMSKTVDVENETGGSETIEYYVPWYDSDLAISSGYDGNLYYQMNGGWGKSEKKEISKQEIGKNVENNDGTLVTTYAIETEETEISSENSSGLSLYDETVRTMKTVDSVHGLKGITDLNDGMIVYVRESDQLLSTIKNVFFKNVLNQGLLDKLDEIDEDDLSPYFYLVDKKHYDSYYYYDKSGTIKNGWINISKSDIINAKGYGVDVLYYENIIENNDANNPHIGYNKYDDGTEYFEYFDKIFKYSIDNDNFNDNAYDCTTGDLDDEIKNVGFDNLINEDGTVNYILDNQKTWYFSNDENEITDNNTNTIRLLDTYNPLESRKGYSPIYRPFYGNDSEVIDFEKKVGKDFLKEHADNFFESKLEPFDFVDNSFYKDDTKENGYSTLESADSVMNTKKITIDFVVNGNYVSDFRKYLNKCILPYLKQVIPSTAIFEYNVNSNSDYQRKAKYNVNLLDAAGYTDDTTVLIDKYTDL